jgi:hypothetical protein
MDSWQAQNGGDRGISYQVLQSLRHALKVVNEQPEFLSLYYPVYLQDVHRLQHAQKAF